MAEEASGAPPPPPVVVTRTAPTTVGQTALGGGSVISISAVLSWFFSCLIAHKLEMPNEQTLEAMALGVVLIVHGAKKLISHGGDRRATDGATK